MQETFTASSFNGGADSRNSIKKHLALLRPLGLADVKTHHPGRNCRLNALIAVFKDKASRRHDPQTRRGLAVKVRGGLWAGRILAGENTVEKVVKRRFSQKGTGNSSFAVGDHGNRQTTGGPTCDIRDELVFLGIGGHGDSQSDTVRDDALQVQLNGEIGCKLREEVAPTQTGSCHVPGARHHPTMAGDGPGDRFEMQVGSQKQRAIAVEKNSFWWLKAQGIIGYLVWHLFPVS